MEHIISFLDHQECLHWNGVTYVISTTIHSTQSMRSVPFYMITNIVTHSYIKIWNELKYIIMICLTRFFFEICNFADDAIQFTGRLILTKNHLNFWQHYWDKQMFWWVVMATESLYYTCNDPTLSISLASWSTCLVQAESKIFTL